MAENEQSLVLVSATEQAAISRAVLTWLDSYTEKPGAKVDFEYLGKTSGLCVSTVQTAYKTRQYINGGYQAQYQFSIVYRLIADNADARLDADEALNEMGEWAEQNPPGTLPEGVCNWRTKRDTGAALMARYDNNAEDHAIQLTLTYEVI